MNDILKYEVIPLLDIKSYLLIREINNEINNFNLLGLPNKLKHSDIMIDTDFAKKYPDLILGKNVNPFEYYFNYDGNHNWDSITDIKLSEKFLMKYIENFDSNDLYKILYNQILLEKNIDTIIQKIKDKNKYYENIENIWIRILKYQKISESFIEKYIDDFKNEISIWDEIFKLEIISPQFIIKYFHFFDTKEINSKVFYQKIPIELVKQFPDKINWKNIYFFRNDLPKELIFEYWKEFKFIFKWKDINMTIKDYEKLKQIIMDDANQMILN